MIEVSDDEILKKRLKEADEIIRTSQEICRLLLYGSIYRDLGTLEMYTRRLSPEIIEYQNKYKDEK